MTAPLRKGWCPTLMTPMASGDGLLVRLKPTAARLPAAAARAVAAAARRFGNGAIDLTNRGNLQFRGLTEGGVAPFAEIVVGLGLAAPDPAVEAVRTVLADPLGPDDPRAAFDSHQLARAIEAMLASDPDAVRLPGKFGILVDGGGTIPLTGVAADIMVRTRAGAPALALDGGDRIAPLAPDAAVDATARLIRAFLARAAGREIRRMRDLVGQVGAAAIFAEAGVEDVLPIEAERTVVPEIIGFTSLPGRDTGAFGVGAPFGQIGAASLEEAAALAETHGDGTLRLTPWRALLLPGIAAEDVATVCRRATAAGLIAAPNDPRRRITACVGRPGCSAATVDTRADAAWLAARDLPGPAPIHLSGCAKGCAHPHPAAITLVGENGRYALVRDGRAGDPPERHGLDREAAAAVLGREPASLERVR